MPQLFQSSQKTHYGQLTSTRALPEISRSLQIINIQQIHATIIQRPPDAIPRAHGPTRLVPVPRLDALGMRDGDLRSEEDLLRIVEPAGAEHAWENHVEVDTGDGRDGRGDVAECQQRERRVVEVVARGDALDLVEWGIARADDGDGAGVHVGAVVGGEVPRVAEGLERVDDGWEGGGAVRLDVDEEVERLARGGVVDAVLGGAVDEGAVWVLALQDRQDGLDVEAVQGALVGQGGLIVADVEGAVVEPDVGLDADCAYFQGRVEGYLSPVVIVRVLHGLG